MDNRKTRKLRPEPYDACSTQEPSPEISVNPRLRTLGGRRSHSAERAHPRSMHSQICQDLLDSVSRLCSEFLKDFTQRKQTRLRSKNPLEDLQRYTLKIDRNYRQKLRSQLSDLSFTGSRGILHEKLTECAVKFVSDLGKEIHSLSGRGRLLRVICLNEAYATLSNASKELGCVVAPIFRGTSLSSLMFSAFYDEVLNGSSDLLDYAYGDENRHWAVKELVSNEREMETGQWRKIAFSGSSSEDESTQEVFQKMSVEDLVSFINHGGNKKNKKRVRRKKNARENQEPSDDVERFRRKLDQEFLIENRLKPCISQGYLESLRNKILKSGN